MLGLLELVTSFCSRFNCAALACCCLSSALAHSGGSVAVSVGEPASLLLLELTLTDVQSSSTTVRALVVGLEPFRGTGFWTGLFLRHR